jgi:hypothetical protein
MSSINVNTSINVNENETNNVIYTYKWSYFRRVLLVLALSHLTVHATALSTGYSANTSTSTSTNNNDNNNNNNLLASENESMHRPLLTLPQLSLTLSPMLGVNMEFRAADASKIVPINESYLDSIIPLPLPLPSHDQPKEEETISTSKSKRTQFNSDAQVHILRPLPSIMGEWSPSNAIKAAEQHNLWSTGRHHLYPTTDIPAKDLPNGIGKATINLATQLILPSIAYAFDTPLSNLHFKDMFLAKYQPRDEYGNGQPGLGKHTDGSAFSFNMLLSDPLVDFEGGGTWISPVGLVQPGRGDVLMHRGNVLHEGCPVVKGTRYVLVGFVQSDNDESHDNSPSKEKSELLLKTIDNFPLGLVIEVDEGDEITCAMIANVVENGSASKAGIQKGDCIRGIILSDNATTTTAASSSTTNCNFLEFDGKSFDQVMDDLISRKEFNHVQMVIERWCSE